MRLRAKFTASVFALTVGLAVLAQVEPAQAMVHMICWQDTSTGQILFNPKFAPGPKGNPMTKLDLTPRHLMVLVACPTEDDDDPPLNYLGLFNSGTPPTVGPHWWELDFWR
jgi:hypothetical protein